MNFQNLTKTDRGDGINLRYMLIPAPGHVFISADYSQIEPRVLLWLTGGDEQLELIRGGMDVYEARARLTGRYKGEAPLAEADPQLRQTMKIEGLGLQYQMGAARLYQMAVASGFDISRDGAKKLVRQYRRDNPGVVKFWNQLGTRFKLSRGKDFEIELPSGRVLRYARVHVGVTEVTKQDGTTYKKRGYKASNLLGEAPRMFYGGKLCENVVQAVARDVLAEAILHLENAGFPVVLHVHDEVLIETPQPRPGHGPVTLTMVEKIMTKLPEWAEGLPVATEAKYLSHYTK